MPRTKTLAYLHYGLKSFALLPPKNVAGVGPVQMEYVLVNM